MIQPVQSPSVNSSARRRSLAKLNFAERPFIVIWEVTQACDLKCLHCRAEAQPDRHPGELTEAESLDLLRQVREADPGVLVLSGGDPMKRPDVYRLVREGRRLGLRMAMTPSVTPLLTNEALACLAAAGLTRIAFSLDGSTPAVHDGFRGVAGSYARTLEVIDVVRSHGMSVQINTTVSRHNYDDLPALVDLLRSRDIDMWSVFFLVPVGRGQADQRITPEQYEQVFEMLWRLRQQVRFEIKTTEAPHYRRFVLEKLKQARSNNGNGNPPTAAYTSLNINDGRGFVFISHTGEVYPSGFLAESVGSIRRQPLLELYRESWLMRQLRDAGNLEGKCGSCEYRKVCGGSRARAWAITGNHMAEEPDCAYHPQGRS